jgi:hypothetical protein
METKGSINKELKKKEKHNPLFKALDREAQKRKAQRKALEKEVRGN